MHLLQAGVDLATIQTWLGHVDISTTHDYIEIDMEDETQSTFHLFPDEHVRRTSQGSGPA